MSITFFLPREFTSEREDRNLFAAPCPECGGHNLYADLGDTPRVEAPVNCPSCLGYGGDQEAEATYWERRRYGDGEFNVANGNGLWIIQAILGLAPTYGGSISPTVVLMRCNAFLDPASGVEEPRCEQTVKLSADGVGLGPVVCYGGRSLEQIESYVERLKRLASIALDRGAPEIHWG